MPEKPKRYIDELSVDELDSIYRVSQQRQHVYRSRLLRALTRLREKRVTLYKVKRTR